jgi:TonB-dependent starch-binding outer membrane protein SusC
MKISWLTLIFIILQATSGFTQDSRLSIHGKDISLQEVFNRIENQSEYRFFYNNDEVDVSQRIDIDITGLRVKKAMEKIFKDLPYTFREFENKLFLIEPDLKKPPVQVKEVSKIQQAAVVSGQVTDKWENPLPGVTVIVEGSNSGTVTGKQGTFSLALPRMLKI